mgnify:CR=1 FL=1
MSKFKVGDKVALKDNPYYYLGRVVNLVAGCQLYYLIAMKGDKYRIVSESEIVALQELPNMSNNEIYNMLKPKMDNILDWKSVESIKNDPFPPQIFEWIGNTVNVRYQQYCTELDVKQAIALAYRSGYLRAKKGRPFKIGGEKY